MRKISSRSLAAILACLAYCFVASAHADPPAFTGRAVQASGANTLVNLRAQGAITGTAPLNVQVNAVRVGGVLSPLISIVRQVLQPGASTSVCVQVQNLLGLDLTFLGVEMDVTVTNASAPAGVNGRIVVQTGVGGEDVSALACADTVQLAPTANAGPDQDVADTDRAAGENVILNGTGSVDPDGSIVSYQWLNSSRQVIATGATPTVRLPDGRQTITLVVTDNTGVSGTDIVVVNVNAPAANRLPVARAGGNRVVADTDAQAGENVTLDATASTDPDGTIVAYQWLIGQSTVLATTATATVRLPDGPQTITLKVTDNAGGVATDTAVITVGAPNPAVAPVARAGADRAVADTDGVTGEVVTLDGSASSDPDGTIATYAWQRGGQTIATGVTPTLRLPDGENVLTLVVTDNTGNTGSDAVIVTIAAPAGAAPIANAGVDRTIADTDGTAGEVVTLDATASTDPDGTITSYTWKLGAQTLANTATASVRLPDGTNVVTLTVVDNTGNIASAAAQITISAPTTVNILSSIPGLTPNQRQVAVALDSLCPRMAQRALNQALTGGEANLLTQCNALLYASSVPQQIKALDEISPQDLNATRAQTLSISRSQLTNVGERLTAIRRGARGVSLAGLNLQMNGKSVPLNELASSVDKLLSGGASADSKSQESAGLLDSPLGLWMRGNYSFGSKESTYADHGFDADQWGVVGGADYRFSPHYVVGVAMGYATSKVSFNPIDSGDLDSRAVSASVYATMYSEGNVYVDAIVTYMHSNYDSARRVTFDTGISTIDVTANADTGGTTLGAAFTLGYDWNLGGFTIAPSIGYDFLSSRLDEFREHGAAGLDLAYEAQDYSSALANAALRISYAWRTKIGVIVPQVRAEYLHEFIDDDESFRVRFANDPFSDTPLMTIRSETPDQSYWRLAGGLAAQFKHGFAAFAQYERVTSMRYLTYADVSLGLRFEASFK